MNKISISDRGCWEWQAARQRHGYGTFQVGKKNRLAHRFAYEAANGEIPEGLCLDHLCRVRHCVNPDHLEAVTQAENVRRSNLIGQHLGEIHRVKTHCPQGHPYSGDNLWITPDGKSRRCRECGRLNARKQNARRRGLRNDK